MPFTSKPLEDQVAGHSAAPAGGAVGARFSAIVAVVVIAALVGALVVLDRVGKSARAVPAVASVVVVEDSKQLMNAWTSQGLRGVVLVDATRDTGFAWIPPSSIPATGAWPVADVDLQEVFRNGVDRRNVVWVGSKTGVVRSVHYLMTPADFEEKVRGGRAVGARGIARDGKSVTANDEGYLRFLRSSMPAAPGTPTVLNIDASYFIDGSPESLAAQLSGSLSDYRLVTVNRATDATDVPEAARVKADQMAEILREQVSR